mmetsp:Transcript_14080/g.34905  ORF Transcript_14080/g.34905 Transcript_14080/m.34905 type:complete len:296 (+) Transcript_14080:1074-1961(+)
MHFSRSSFCSFCSRSCCRKASTSLFLFSNSARDFALCCSAGDAAGRALEAGAQLSKGTPFCVRLWSFCRSWERECSGRCCSSSSFSGPSLVPRPRQESPDDDAPRIVDAILDRSSPVGPGPPGRSGGCVNKLSFGLASRLRLPVVLVRVRPFASPPVPPGSSRPAARMRCACTAASCRCASATPHIVPLSTPRSNILCRLRFFSCSRSIWKFCARTSSKRGTTLFTAVVEEGPPAKSCFSTAMRRKPSSALWRASSARSASTISGRSPSASATASGVMILLLSPAPASTAGAVDT